LPPPPVSDSSPAGDHPLCPKIPVPPTPTLYTQRTAASAPGPDNPARPVTKPSRGAVAF